MRNWLLTIALRDHDWVLWLDSDLWDAPHDLLQKLMASKKDLVVPNCIVADSDPPRTYDLNSWQETPESLQQLDGLPASQLVVEGYGERPTFRKHIGSLGGQCSSTSLEGAGEDTDQNAAAAAQPRPASCTVKLDGIGGSSILARGDLFRSGLNFPAFVFQHAVETEGLAKVAKAMGHQPYGMPNVHVFHK